MTNLLTILLSNDIIIKLAYGRGKENGQVQEVIIEHVDIDYWHVCVEAIGLFFDASLHGDFIDGAIRNGGFDYECG